MDADFTQQKTECGASPSRDTRDVDQRAQFEALLAATGTAAITFDRAGQILSWNGCAERMFGFAADTAVGMSMDAILPRLNQTRKTSAKLLNAASAWLCALYPGESRQLTMGRHRDGHLFPVQRVCPVDGGWASEELTGRHVYV